MGKYRSEWKYCIDNVSLQPIKERLLAIMDRDSHANENGKYEIHSLYFDDFQNTCARENMAGDGISEYSTHLVRSFRTFSAGHPEIQCNNSGCQCSPL